MNEAAFVPEPISEAESLAVRADFLVHTGRYADAQPMLEEALKYDPKLAAAYESMGLLYAEQNKIERGEQVVFPGGSPELPKLPRQLLLCDNLFKGGMDDELAAKAEASLRTAIQINPQFAPAYDALAYLLATRHRELEEARLLALQAIDWSPGTSLPAAHGAGTGAVEPTGRRPARGHAGPSMAKTPEETADAQAALERSAAVPGI